MKNSRCTLVLASEEVSCWHSGNHAMLLRVSLLSTVRPSNPNEIHAGVRFRSPFCATHTHTQKKQR